MWRKKKKSVSHYLLECPKYENEREILRKRLFDYRGISHVDSDLLLERRGEELKDWRDPILSELEN